jgi:low affinity Fe/Cu permease
MKTIPMNPERCPAVTLLREMFGAFARSVNDFSASHQATGLAFIIILVWAVSGPLFHFSDGWQLVINTGTTIVTFLMVFVLNNAQSRDTRAMNTKLDAIIYAIDAADNRLIGLERKGETEADRLHSAFEEQTESAQA